MSKLKNQKVERLFYLQPSRNYWILNSIVKESCPYPIYFEGDAEISTFVSHFQNEVESVLCSVHLWEGLDIPGKVTWKMLLSYSLPFPPNDPVFTAKRETYARSFSGSGFTLYAACVYGRESEG